MDNDPFAGKLGQWMLKCTSYWQSVLRVGIPFTLAVHGIAYVEFRSEARNFGAKYPYFFPGEFIADVCIVLFVSAVFCWLTRKLSALEQSNQLPLPWRGCWLHRSRATCVLAMAFWTFPLTGAVLEITGTLHPKVDWLAVPVYGVGIWLLATLVTDCKRRLERLFYGIGIVQMSIVAAHTAIPMSAVVTRFCEFADATLSAIEIVLSGTILLWHFRKRMDDSDSREPT